MGSSLQHVTILDPSAAWLKGRERNDTSQFGEDGLIEAVLDRIGEANRWCFEVGAADGEFYSNTKRLRQAGWKSVLIEAGADQYKVLSQLSNANTYTFNETVKADSLDRILSSVDAPTDLDLGVIDIDGQDYWAWSGMRQFRPRVMLVEFMYLNDKFQDPAFVPPENGLGQAGLEAITGLGQSKGYLPIVSTFCNVLFVRDDLWKAA